VHVVDFTIFVQYIVNILDKYNKTKLS